MGHYGDLYDAEQDAMKREKLLEQDENLSTQFDDLNGTDGKVQGQPPQVFPSQLGLGALGSYL